MLTMIQFTIPMRPGHSPTFVGACFFARYVRRKQRFISVRHFAAHLMSGENIRMYVYARRIP